MKQRGLDPLLPIMRAHGVPGLIAYLGGRLSLDEAVARGKADTRAYAKRQVTWFRHQMEGWTAVEPEVALDAALAAGELEVPARIVTAGASAQGHLVSGEREVRGVVVGSGQLMLHGIGRDELRANLRRFLEDQSSSGIVLMVASAVAIVAWGAMVVATGAVVAPVARG